MLIANVCYRIKIKMKIVKVINNLKNEYQCIWIE